MYLSLIFGVLNYCAFWMSHTIYDASQENFDQIFKISIHDCLDSNVFRVIYCCIVIHQIQSIDAFMHCTVATLLYR